MTEPTTDLSLRGRHRGDRTPGRGPATAVAAGVAAGALALAAYAGTSRGGTMDTAGLEATMSRLTPELGAEAVTTLHESTAADVQRVFSQARALRERQAEHSLNLSSGLLDDSATQVRAESSAIAQERAEARRRAAEKAAAERAAREQAAREAKAAAAQRAAEKAAEAKAAAAAEKAAEAKAAADARAAEQQAAQAAAQRQATQASRSAARQAPSTPTPAPVASGGSPRAIAQSMLGSYGWGSDQFGCLDPLWQRESGWNVYATNSSSGAYGIPQALPGSKMATAGGDWQTNAATQIRWGLGYIAERYGSPCGAWAHSEAYGWY